MDAVGTFVNDSKFRGLLYHVGGRARSHLCHYRRCGPNSSGAWHEWNEAGGSFYLAFRAILALSLTARIVCFWRLGIMVLSGHGLVFSFDSPKVSTERLAM